MKVENVGTKSHTFVKLALVFFISLLSFSIGIFVGKNFSDNQHQLAQLEPSAKKAGGGAHGDEHASVSESAPGEELTDAEISKLADEFVEEESPVTIEKKPEGAAEAAAENTGDKERTTASINEKDVKPGVKADKLSDVAAALADDKVPKLAPVKKGIPVTRTLPEEVAGGSIGKFTIQVGSYPVEAEAKKVSEDLKKKGYAAFYVAATIKTQTYYRVNIGLFGSQKEAVEYKKQLAETAFSNGFIQKIIK